MTSSLVAASVASAAKAGADVPITIAALRARSRGCFRFILFPPLSEL